MHGSALLGGARAFVCWGEEFRGALLFLPLPMSAQSPDRCLPLAPHPPPNLGIFLGTKKDYQSLAPRWQGQGWEWGQSAFEKQSRLGDQLGEEGEEPEGGKGDEDKTSGWLGLTSCPLGDSPDDPSAAILSSFIGYSFKARLQRQAGEEHGWEGVPGRTTQNLHGSVPSFPDCFPNPAANSNYIFTHRSLHPRHHSQPLPHVGGVLLFPFYR